MKEIFITIAGTNHQHGDDFIKAGMKVKLVKEPDNPVDTEAIKIMLPGLGLIGYVANSPYTVAGECMSAGRLYDKIGDTAKAVVVYAVPGHPVCRVLTKSITCWEGMDDDDDDDDEPKKGKKKHGRKVIRKVIIESDDADDEDEDDYMGDGGSCQPVGDDDFIVI